ncbi:ATP-dependent RNA helicase DHX8 [Lasiosphaeria miniovina]|uniref:ATP-dependent RNA helicase DHX8 n=1 Tax=Lasiosphaeria miniovina TaxID=1954250 RepID=A0AA40AU61_9PEZI|nr:ATP-dependent RNA helicase DHX8 [Lasiosphaeria miniovina]KAK0722007.1 ATP-dependent RNA helicase DHX8 [Lasiosphaeria miniovina]
MESTTAPTLPASPPPYREIRALFDDGTITVYQAYSGTIASAAVAAQRLNASPAFSTTRMTWIKPSWAWMLYRAGYSHKDKGQERILALRMKHADFLSLLEKGVVPREGSMLPQVRIQWDPERTVRLEKLGHRSIQIGVPGALSAHWAENLIVSIEDVTQAARDLKKVLDERPNVSDDELVRLGLVPVERPFPVPEELQRALGMILPPPSDLDASED